MRDLGRQNRGEDGRLKHTHLHVLACSSGLYFSLVIEYHSFGKRHDKAFGLNMTHGGIVVLGSASKRRYPTARESQIYIDRINDVMLETI